MIGREREVNLPLITENFIAAVKMGLVGTDVFWQQFDQFTINLIPPSSVNEDTPPLILISAEFHIPSNTQRIPGAFSEMHTSSAIFCRSNSSAILTWPL